MPALRSISAPISRCDWLRLCVEILPFRYDFCRPHRAVNRALRKAYGIGICSVEEIGSFAEPSISSKKLPPHPANGNYGGRKVRDHLCQLIRHHQLDATLVKSYATDFCGVKTLREATREQVENFVVHLADWAEKNRDALLCQLDSYLPTKEGAA
jgi:hypothetical protein